MGVEKKERDTRRLESRNCKGHKTFGSDGYVHYVGCVTVSGKYMLLNKKRVFNCLSPQKPNL